MSRLLFRVILLILLILLLILAFFAVTRGIANYYADERNGEASLDNLGNAVAWNPNHSYALAMLAKQNVKQENYDRAEKLAFRSLANNPTYGLSTSIIIGTADKQNDSALATKAIDFTQKLSPARDDVQIAVVEYWAKREKLSGVLPAWNVILSQNPQVSRAIFPLMFKLTQIPTGAVLFEPYAIKPSVWWSHFFVYLTRQKANLSSLQTLYQMRLTSVEPLSNIERSSYIERLIREKHWSMAYFSWLSGLEKDDLQYSQSTLYDGGFESRLHNTGFDWYYFPNKIVSIEPAITRGMHGKTALHVNFNKRERINFQHISQKLILPAGEYALRFRSRVDRLRTEKGLKWRVRCLGDQNIILGESRSLLGASPWRNEAFYFTVPDNKNCKAQLLRLEVSSPYAHNHLFLGSIWFDDIKIDKENVPSKTENKTEKKNEK